jgi:hypothetical protein
MFRIVFCEKRIVIRRLFFIPEKIFFPNLSLQVIMIIFVRRCKTVKVRIKRIVFIDRMM